MYQRLPEKFLQQIPPSPKARFPDFQDPLVITPQRGTKECTVENAVTMLHKEILEDFKCALVWGRSVEALWFLGVGRVAKEEQYNEVKV